MSRTTARLTGLTGALIASTLTLTGCSGDAVHEGMSDMTDSSSASSSAAGSESSTTFNDADVAFAQGMLPHHRQAVEMAQLAADRAADPRVMDLAARIEAAQATEIQTLTEWLDAWGAEAAGSTGMDHGRAGHGDSGGMMSTGDMADLANTSGADFDRMFVDMMLVHHRGAVQMAGTEIAEGEDPDAITMAENIRDSQTTEIAEMQQLLTELGG